MAAVERFADGVSQFSGRRCRLRGCSRQPPPAIFLVLVGRDTMCRLLLRKTMVVSYTRHPHDVSSSARRALFARSRSSLRLPPALPPRSSPAGASSRLARTARRNPGVSQRLASRDSTAKTTPTTNSVTRTRGSTYDFRRCVLCARGSACARCVRRARIDLDLPT